MAIRLTYSVTCSFIWFLGVRAGEFSEAVNKLRESHVPLLHNNRELCQESHGKTEVGLSVSKTVAQKSVPNLTHHIFTLATINFESNTTLNLFECVAVLYLVPPGLGEQAQAHLLAADRSLDLSLTCWQSGIMPGHPRPLLSLSGCG